MPLDPRLYMTFPNDFWLHPKIAPLSDAAFRAFVEINGYSRMQDLDGRVPIAAARKHWKVRALNELVANHPERPSLTVDGDDYVIWNYEQHQETRASRARRSETGRANGAKGGRPRKVNPTETQLVSADKPDPNQSQSPESETTDTNHLRPVPHEPDASAEQTDQEVIRESAVSTGIRSMARIRRALAPLIGDAHDAVLIDTTRAVLELATGRVRSVEAYLETACINSPDEIREAYGRVSADWAAARSAAEAMGA